MKLLKPTRSISLLRNKRDHLIDEKIMLQNEMENMKAEIRNLEKDIEIYDLQIKELSGK